VHSTSTASLLSAPLWQCLQPPRRLRELSGQQLQLQQQWQ
jgi:hypothetical protein